MEAGWQGKADGPTVTGEILTPSSTCAVLGSSVSMCSRTCLPQRVLTNVVRPVPEAPQTIRQNWMPFLTFFFLRVLSICNGISAGVQWLGAGVAAQARRELSGSLGGKQRRTEDMLSVEYRRRCGNGCVVQRSRAV